MKKVKIIVAAIFIVAVGASIFWACEKESDNLKNNNNINTQKYFDSGNPENYGIIHNEIANYIIQNQPQLLFLPNTIPKLDSICALSGRYLIENNYFTEIEVQEAINEVRDYYISFGIKTNEELNYYTFCYDTSFVRQQLENVGYSNLLIDQLVVIYQESLDSNISYDTIHSHLFNTMLSTDYGVEKDNLYRDVLINVFEYSNQFWDTLNCYSLPQSQEVIDAQQYINAQRMQEYLDWQERRILDATPFLEVSSSSIMAGINNSYSIRKM
ncbi:MAG: hypothetical protein KBA86_00005 [Bacteroidales bacterium]|nr:hypothetical protein [Bacteroidales bacterium]